MIRVVRVTRGLSRGCLRGVGKRGVINAMCCCGCGFGNVAHMGKVMAAAGGCVVDRNYSFKLSNWFSLEDKTRVERAKRFASGQQNLRRHETPTF